MAQTDKFADAGDKLRVKLVRSPAGRLKNHKACVRGLGLRRMHHEVEVANTPENRGMINRVFYMLEVQAAS